MAKVSKYGQWQYPGEDTIIPNVNGSITMKGVPYPVLGIDDLGYSQMMMPGVDYQFPGNSVYEKPMNKITDPNVIADLIAQYKSNSYRKGGGVLNKYYNGGNNGSSTTSAKEQAREREFNRQQARAWDPNETYGYQEEPLNYNPKTGEYTNWKGQVVRVETKPMVIGSPKGAPKKSKAEIEKEKAIKYDKQTKADPTAWLAEHPEYMLDANGNPILRSMMEQAAPEELKQADIKQAKEEFVKQLNADPLQQSLGKASLDNPVTNAAAERYANYKVNNVDPGRAEDQLFRGYMPPTLQDFYNPNDFSNMVRGAAALGATAAGTAGLSAGLAYLAPYAAAAPGAISTMLEAPMVVGGYTVPGVTVGTTLAGIDAGLATNEFLNPSSQTRESINLAYNDPTWENILGASGSALLAGTGLMGLGIGKQAFDASKEVVNRSKQVIDKVKETNFYKALAPGERAKILQQIQESSEAQTDLWRTMQQANNEAYDARSAIEDKLRNPSFMSYFAKRKLSLNQQGQGQGFLNFIMPSKRKTIDKAGNFILDDGKLVAVEPSPFFAPNRYTGQTIVTSGEKQIIDLRTGKLIDAQVLPAGETKTVSLNTSQKAGKQPGVVEQTTVTSGPVISDPYRETLKSNIAYVEETVPGAKVFGSSRGVSEGNLPHLADDYDVFISESNYNKNVKGKFQNTGIKGSAQQHDISPNGAGAGAGKMDPENAYNIDFNIIHENPDGTVKPVWSRGPGGYETSREVELFRQNFPEEFFEAAAAASKSGNPKNIKINKTADELINGLDPTVKTIMDAYESGKPKHINRIDTYINFGNVDKVAEAQEKFAKSLVGKGASIGKQFPESAFQDIEKNKEILKKMGFIGNADVVAQDPKRMQLAINDYYINNSIMHRNVTPDAVVGKKDPTLSFKEWNAKNPQGTAMGIGHNWVKHGSSQHGELFQQPLVSGFRQLSLDTNFDDPLEFVNSVFRQTDGNYILNEDELNTVRSLVEKHFGKDTLDEIENYRIGPLKKSEDLITRTNIGARNNDYTPHDQFLKDVSQELNIKAITSGDYGNSTFKATLDNFNDYLDSLGYGFLGTHMPQGVKSYKQRLASFDQLRGDAKKVTDIVDGREFKTVEGYIKGGLPKAQERLQNLEKEAFEIERELEKLRNAYAKPEREALAELEARADQLGQEFRDASDKVAQLQALDHKIIRLRHNALLAAGGLSLAGAAGASLYSIDKQFKEDLEKGVETKTVFETLFPQVEAFKKKRGGEVKFGSKPFIGYLPFTHYQLK